MSGASEKAGAGVEDPSTAAPATPAPPPGTRPRPGRGARSRERVAVVIEESHEALAREVAERIADLVRSRNEAGERTVLGLATGSTPVGIYQELIRMHRQEGLSFADVVTFNLDEYYPMDPESLQSYHRFMWENLFEHIDIAPENVHIPRGDVPEDEVDAHCRAYEEAIREAGGIDLQILGIGRSGHIGFNEPGSGRESRTRKIFLDTVTRGDAASDFFGKENVPLEAITMGVATILEAREVALVAIGEHKAQIVKRAVEGPVHPDVAATYLQEHPDAAFYLDPAAAAELTRLRTPWLVGEVEWTRQREIEAVIWLSQEVKKSILRLETDDYRDHHLSSLVARYGSAGPLNGEVFNALISKIRGKSKLPAGRRIVVFSPHPDDDVISMGGILRKLAENGNEITVAYQTSGNIAVFDHEVRRYVEFVRRARAVADHDAARRGARPSGALTELGARVAETLDRKGPGDIDEPVVREVKRVIRETEAVSALESVGLGAENARFLNLPFYETGKVRKDPIGERDVEIVLELLEEAAPEIVFAAGDLSDPHGTHRMCLQAVMEALRRYEGPPPEVWLYRGAWQEWSVAEASILVPMSEDELSRKILAIFKHQSQKDYAPFPGPDPREFWQRVEDRNRGTARFLERLGLPAYYAMEAYVVQKDGLPLENPVIPTSALAGEG